MNNKYRLDLCYFNGNAAQNWFELVEYKCLSSAHTTLTPFANEWKDDIIALHIRPLKLVWNNVQKRFTAIGIMTRNRFNALTVGPFALAPTVAQINAYLNLPNPSVQLGVPPNRFRFPNNQIVIGGNAYPIQLNWTVYANIIIVWWSFP